MADLMIEIQLTSATRGLSGTALPDAAADAANGLVISDAGGLDIDATDANVALILTDTAEIGTAGAGLGAGVGMGAAMVSALGGAIQGGQPGQPAAAAAAAGTVCPNCQARIPVGAKFCPQCGQALSAGYCANCGAQLAAGAKFCSECGQAVGAAAPTPPPETPAEGGEEAGE